MADIVDSNAETGKLKEEAKTLKEGIYKLREDIGKINDEFSEKMKEYETEQEKIKWIAWATKIQEKRRMNGKMRRHREGVRRIEKPKGKKEKLMKKRKEMTKEKRLRKMKNQSLRRKSSTEIKRKSMHVLILLTTVNSYILNPQEITRVTAKRKSNLMNRSKKVNGRRKREFLL